jgi:hypothetical protein
MGGPKAPLSPQESVTAMRRLIDTFGPINRASSITMTVANIHGDRSAVQSEATDTRFQSRTRHADGCRNGNWKIASRDRRSPA